MAGTIGSLGINLELNSAAFVEAMKGAAQTVSASAAQMQVSLSGVAGTIDSLAGNVRGLVAVLAVRELASFAEQGIEAAANIARLAETVGLTTDQFQKYQIAAQQVGVEQDKFNTGITRFVSNLGAAKEGAGSLVQGLHVLNPALLEQLQTSKNTNEALTLFLNYLSEIPDHSEKSRLAVQGLGRGMQQMSLIAQALASDLSTKLAMPPEVIDGARELYEDLKLAETAIENGFTTGIVAAFADDLKVTDDQLVDMKNAAMQFGFAVGQSFNVVVLALKAMHEWWDNTNKAMDSFFSGGLKGVTSLSTDLNNLAVGDNSVVAKVSRAINNMWAAITHKDGELPTLSLDKLRSEMHLDSQAADELAAALKKLAAGFKGGDNSLDNAVPDASLKLAKLNTDLATQAKTLQTLIGDVSKGPVAYVALKASLEAQDEAAKKDINIHTQAGQAYVSNVARIKELQFALGVTQKIYQETLTPLDVYKNKLAEIALAQKNLGITAQQSAQLQFQAGAALADDYLKAAGAMTGALAQLFQNNKEVAIANAVVNTAEAITAALKNPPGPPFSYAYAAAAAATGAAQIAAIMSAQPGSATAPSVTTGGGGSVSDSGVTAAAPVGTTQAVNVQIIGSNFSRAQVIDLMSSIKNLQRDGYTLQ